MDKIVITASQLNTMCFRRWYYEYWLGLDPGGPSAAMITGIDYHALRAGEVTEVEDERAMAMYKAWCEISEHLEPRYSVIESEKFVLADAGEFYLAGRLDGIVELDDGRRGILEIKTGISMPSANYFAGKEIDAQLLMYSLLTGYRTIVLDFTRAPGIKKSRYRDYEAECYKRMIAKPESYFVRAVFEITEEEIERFERDLMIWYEIVKLQLDRQWFLRLSRACQSWKGCPYWSLCSGRATVEDWPRKPSLYPELEPELSKLIKSEES